MNKIKELYKKYISVSKCTTVSEAKQQSKDRLKILMLGGIFGAAYILFTVISQSRDDFFATLSGIMMIPAVVCIVAGIWLYYSAKTEERRLGVILCKQCGTKFEYDNAQYEFLSQRRSAGNPNNQGVIHFTVVHTYKFNCKCAKCGAESTFNGDFIERQGQMRNKVVLSEHPRDVEQAIRAFFE